MAWGYFPPWVEPEGNCYQGGIITAMCKEGPKWDGTGYGTVIQTPALPLGSFGAIMPWVSGADMKQRMMKYPRTAHILALTRDLKISTNNFSPAALLGRGGFGTVYKRVLPKGKNTVAVKRVTKDSSRGKEEFISEISVINRLRHKNLVPQLGWCHKNGQLIMVYEFMPNGSVDKHIFNDDVAGGFLNWERRYNIVSGVTSALLYLHEECEQQVIHRGLKTNWIIHEYRLAETTNRKGSMRLDDWVLCRIYKKATHPSKVLPCPERDPPSPADVQQKSAMPNFGSSSRLLQSQSPFMESFLSHDTSDANAIPFYMEPSSSLYVVPEQQSTVNWSNPRTPVSMSQLGFNGNEASSIYAATAQNTQNPSHALQFQSWKPYVVGAMPDQLMYQLPFSKSCNPEPPAWTLPPGNVWSSDDNG